MVGSIPDTYDELFALLDYFAWLNYFALQNSFVFVQLLPGSEDLRGSASDQPEQVVPVFTA